MNPPRCGRFDGLTCAVDILFIGTGKPADTRALDGLGNGLDRFEVPIACRREAGFDDIHTQSLKGPGNTNLLLTRHRCARALFPVAKRGVENYQAVCIAHRLLTPSLRLSSF